jgi:hypothetical protein
MILEGPLSEMNYAWCSTLTTLNKTAQFPNDPWTNRCVQFKFTRGRPIASIPEDTTCETIKAVSCELR